MRSSRAFRKMLVGLGVGLIVIEIAARALQPHVPASVSWDSPFAQAKAEAAAEMDHVDVVVVGSSIGNANLDPPRIIDGIPWAGSGYNAALPAEAPRQWEVWVQDVVLPDLCPTLMVVAVGPRDTNDNKLDTERAVAQYRASVGRLALYGAESFLAGLELRIEALSALVATRERLREPANVLRFLRDEAAPGWPNLNLTDAGRYRGFDDDPTYERDQERDQLLANGALADYEVGDLEFGALDRLIVAAQDRSITVVLVAMPYLRTELAVVVDDGVDDLERFDERLRRLARDRDVPLLSYPEFVDAPDLYADHYHMVGIGSARLSEQIGTDLGFLVPERPASPTCPARDADRMP